MRPCNIGTDRRPITFPCTAYTAQVYVIHELEILSLGDTILQDICVQTHQIRRRGDAPGVALRARTGPGLRQRSAGEERQQGGEEQRPEKCLLHCGFLSFSSSSRPLSRFVLIRKHSTVMITPSMNASTAEST